MRECPALGIVVSHQAFKRTSTACALVDHFAVMAVAGTKLQSGRGTPGLRKQHKSETSPSPVRRFFPRSKGLLMLTSKQTGRGYQALQHLKGGHRSPNFPIINPLFFCKKVAAEKVEALTKQAAAIYPN